jgi:cobalamin biosynthesis protein CbiD
MAKKTKARKAIKKKAKKVIKKAVRKAVKKAMDFKGEITIGKYTLTKR